MPGGRRRAARRVTRLLDRALRPLDLAVAPRRRLREAERWGGRLEPPAKPSLPEGAELELRADHPRLLELRRRYEGHPGSGRSLWTDRFVGRTISLPCFRLDNAFVWQAQPSWTLPDAPGSAFEPSPTREVNYALTTYYARTVDRLSLLDRCSDDDLFGNLQVRVDGGPPVSRDLLDSTLEINFLDRTLGLAGWDRPTILDIGAGYGRLAHRIAEALPSARVLCTDGIPESSFVCEYYLRFRGVENAAGMVPLDAAAGALAERPVDLAVNVHSFSECPLEVVIWWLDLVQASAVKYLLIVPNTHTHLWAREPDGEFRDFAPALRERGYRRIACEPKYGGATSVQQHGIFPTYYHLFELVD